MHAADVAFVLEALPPDDRRTVWEQVEPEQAGLVFVEVSRGRPRIARRARRRATIWSRC